MMRLSDRYDAGQKLGKELARFKDSDVIVYALPRGGVAVGFGVARALRAPLDLVIARKIGHPSNPEYAVCAVTETGELICNKHEHAALDPRWLAAEARKEQNEAIRRRQTYLGDREHILAKNKIAIIVDDGIATGLTIRAATQSLRKEKPRKLIVAVPVAPHETVELLRTEADEVVALESRDPFLGAVGAYYDDFPQMTDDEVISLLKDPPQKIRHLVAGEDG